MNRSIKTWAAAAVLAVSLGAKGHGQTVVSPGFLPENKLRIPVGDMHALGIQENVFNRVLDRVQKIYGPIIAKKGGKLVIDRNWEDATVNAYAMQNGAEWHIAMFGGLARHEAITEDGFALVACHEIGHHIGGFPKKMGWATNEGGADYFATLKCLRLVLNSTPRKVDPVVVKACSSRYRNRTERARCEGGSMAGYSVTKLFTDLGGEKAVSFTTPDPAVVEETDDSHPAAQCRLDTYFQGALCTKPLRDELGENEPHSGACTRKQGYNVGLRPRCWFKPPADEPEAPKPGRRLVLLDSKTLGEKLDAIRGAIGGK
jgi:hypothetical protein